MKTPTLLGSLWIWAALAGCGGGGGDSASEATYVGSNWTTYTTPSGRTVDALLNRPVGSDVRPAVLFNHGLYVEENGYADAADDSDGDPKCDVNDYVTALAAAGYVAVAPIRPAGLTYEDLRELVRAGIDYLKGRSDVDSARIYLMGFSKGGFLSLQVAVENDSDLAGLILFSPSEGGGSTPWSDWTTTPQLQEIDVPAFLSVGELESSSTRARLNAFVRDLEVLSKSIQYEIVPGADHQWFYEVHSKHWTLVIGWLAAL